MKQKQSKPPHPGEILKEFYLTPLNLTISAAAKILSTSRPRLSDIVNGKQGISASMALKLSKRFKTTPIYWLNLQNYYDLYKAKHK